MLCTTKLKPKPQGWNSWVGIWQATEEFLVQIRRTLNVDCLKNTNVHMSDRCSGYVGLKGRRKMTTVVLTDYTIHHKQ